jgi:hypothetical protein
MSIGHAAAAVHRDGYFYRHRQHPQVAFSMAVPPYAESVLAELHSLGVGAPQVQSSHLIDREVTECRIAGAQESVIGLEVLQGQVEDGIAITAIGVARVGFREQCVHRVAIGQKVVVVIFPESSLSNDLHHPVHLNQIPGSVNFR